MTKPIELEATHMRDNLYAVRPKGQLGTCGFHPIAWVVEYVRARSATHAIDIVSRDKHPCSIPKYMK